jgi:integrase
VLELTWPDVDMERRTAWVHADEAKGGESIGVPLNDEAMAVLREELGKHPLRVFTYKGRPVGQANTRAWRNALKRAGIKNFRWHDLRHVWATFRGAALASRSTLSRQASTRFCSVLVMGSLLLG